ncbi:MAG TPA: trypsin-like peptidase domain-containing protein [Elusimicrobiales bacterium]|nr:trypsin-like peptidase domain-containing protein [Elusimicrobiales bacterium]
MRNGILLALVFFPLTAAAQGAAELQQAFNAAAAKAGPAVVSVQVVKEETQAVIEPDYYFGYSLPSEKLYRFHSSGLGSGVIVDKRGYVLTNRHVVENAVRINVITQDAAGVEKEWPASIAGIDPAQDLAVLRIKGGGVFPWLDLNSAAALKVGDFVLAVGYPFGFKQTVTSGIISALDASLPVEGRRYEKLIQTDAAINFGNSGGPLLNLKGEVIGINTAIASPTGVFAGMGFAVPASEIKRVLEDLIAGREIRRGWLGVSLQRLDAIMASRLGLARPAGAIVNISVEGSPAYKAGLRRGDIVLSCDGAAINSHEDLLNRTYARSPGDEVELVYLRDGARRKLRVKLGDRYAKSPAAAGPAKGGDSAPAGSGFEWERVRFAYSGGARVLAVSEDSRLSGYLWPGDIIKAVNGAPVAAAGQMAKVLAAANLSEGVVFDLLRDGESMYLSVQAK